MKKDSRTINTKKVNSEETEWGTFPFIITRNGTYDQNKSLSHVYELYVNMLYEK